MTPDDIRRDSQYTATCGNNQDKAISWMLLVTAELCERWDKTNELLDKIAGTLEGIEINGRPNPNA